MKKLNVCIKDIQYFVRFNYKEKDNLNITYVKDTLKRAGINVE